MSGTDFHKMSVAELEAALRLHNWKYWVENAPEISDYEYDRLVEALRSRRPDSPLLEAIGEAGADSAEHPAEPTGEKVTHQRPMLSLDKCYTDEVLLKWFEKFEGDAVVTPKVDGVAASIRYDVTGRLELAATRGNGRVGELISDNIKYVHDVPARLPVGPVEVRGEVYMPISVFERDFAGDFANPRNLTAGALKQKDAPKTRGYQIRFMAYDLEPDEGIQLETEEQKAAYLTELGFRPVDSVTTNRADGAFAFRELQAKSRAFDFETDGVVFKANRLDEQARLGVTAHHPRYAIAYKFQGESAASVLRDVEWSVSRTGAINPVAIVDPVTLSGATVTRASLHNLSIMAKLGGSDGLKVGSQVLMMRRGGVIPHVEQVIEPGDQPVVPPTVCPACGGKTYSEDDVLQAEHTPSCSATRLGELQHFVRVIEAKGFGPKLLAQLIDAGLVEQPADFFALTVDALMSLERVGQKSAEKLVEQMDSRRDLPVDILLCALGIDELGPVVARTLATAFSTLPAIQAATEEDIAAIHGLGEVIARNVVTGLESRKDELRSLLSHVRVSAAAVVPGAADDGPLAGKSFLFTGALESMKRKEAQERVRALGGEAPSSVVATLTHLVLGEGDLAKFQAGWRSSKLKRAEQLNAGGARIEIVGEVVFLEMIGDSP